MKELEINLIDLRNEMDGKFIKDDSVNKDIKENEDLGNKIKMKDDDNKIR